MRCNAGGGERVLYLPSGAIFSLDISFVPLSAERAAPLGETNDLAPVAKQTLCCSSDNCTQTDSFGGRSILPSSSKQQQSRSVIHVGSLHICSEARR